MADEQIEWPQLVSDAPIPHIKLAPAPEAVERVARAICLAEHPDWDWNVGNFGLWKDGYYKMAKAAIAALRGQP